MKYNSGDMDDLFRRASEKYPLRTDGADWDRLAGALDGDPSPAALEDERRRRRGLFWWFLLIPLAGIGYLTWQMGTSHVAPKPVVMARPAANNAGADANAVAAPNPAGNSVAASNPANSSTDRTGRTIANSGAVRHVGGTGTRNMPSNGMTSRSAGSNSPESVTSASTRPTLASTRPTTLPAGQNSSPKGVTLSPDVTLSPRRQTSSRADRDPDLALLDLRLAPIPGDIHIDVNVVVPPQKSQPTKITARPRIYIGLTAAPDFSTVKFQSMKGVGTTFGLLLGYSFNDRWAVETGLYLDRKRYYTEGEYFNTSKVRLSSYDKLLNVDGTCYMWEIPVNVRYNFGTGPRMQWFATAGLSTYLMSRENYTYQYEYNNRSNIEESSWNIHKPSQYWFSIANLSAGFEQRLGKIGDLRVEPYFRIPLSGVGTGKLAIMSAGVNIGLTHRLWK